MGGIFRADDLDDGINFFVTSAAANRFKIRQAAKLDNFIYVADSFREPRRRSFGESLRVQSDAGGNNLWRDDKLAISAVNNFGELADVHDFADKIDRRNRKTFIAAEKNRGAESRISNDDDDSNPIRADAFRGDGQSHQGAKIARA